ncbi:MAG: hypothetical protein ACYDCX_11575 [Acidithiobacillus sp.]
MRLIPFPHPFSPGIPRYSSFDFYTPYAGNLPGSGLGAVLAWTVGAAAVSGLILVGLLRNNLAH